MKTFTDRILLFRTNIPGLCPNCEASRILDGHAEISQWSIDTEDIDRVLRVVSATLTPETIIGIINQHGFECSELE